MGKALGRIEELNICGSLIARSFSNRVAERCRSRLFASFACAGATGHRWNSSNEVGRLMAPESPLLPARGFPSPARGAYSVQFNSFMHNIVCYDIFK
jgi:hypothetical protein